MRPRKAFLLVLLLALAQLLTVASAEGPEEGERPGGKRGLRALDAVPRHQEWVRPATLGFRVEPLHKWPPAPTR